MAVSFPVIALLFDISLAKGGSRWGQTRSKWRLYLLYIILTLFYLALRFSYLKNPQEKFLFHGESAAANMLTMVRVIAYYIKLALLPANLNADYVAIIPNSALQPQLLVGYAIIGAALVLTVLSFRRSKGAFLGAAWFLVALGPVSNLVPIKIIMAERYLYLPSVGIALLLGAAFEALCRARSGSPGRGALKVAPVALLVLLVLFFSAVTFKRNYVWRDEYSLWSATVKDSPISTRASTNLGLLLVKRGRHDEAIRLFRYALWLKPNIAETMNDLAVAFFKSGRPDKALAEFKALLAVKPYFVDGHINLGKFFHERRMLSAAMAQFNKALEVDPRNVFARNNLGVVLYQLGDLDKALHQYIEANRSAPWYADVHKNLGVVYLGHAKKYPKALYHFRETLRLNPAEAQAKLIAAKIKDLEKLETGRTN